MSKLSFFGELKLQRKKYKEQNVISFVLVSPILWTGFSIPTILRLTSDLDSFKPHLRTRELTVGSKKEF